MDNWQTLFGYRIQHTVVFLNELCQEFPLKFILAPRLRISFVVHLFNSVPKFLVFGLLFKYAIPTSL